MRLHEVRSESAPTAEARHDGRGRIGRHVLIFAVAIATALSTAVAAAPASAAPPQGAGQPDFGPNVKIFDPNMQTSYIQATVDAIRDQQINNEMGTDRYALMFKPGTYGTAEEPLIVQVGYNTEVIGLGLNPTDVTINGHVDVYNRCRPATGCFALDSFWRSLSNLTINVTGGEGCRSSANFWAASQASPMRRVNITGGTLSLMDYCTAGPQYASGGFIADSKTGDVVNGSQQQYIVRNSSIGAWSNGVWNQVFSGVTGAPSECFPAIKDVCGPYTTLAKTPASREKPYLYIDSAGKYNVFVPDPRTDSSGASWENGPTPGHGIPLSKFFVAKPSDSVAYINTQLSSGKNLLLTPGVYDVHKTITITRADTVVLGMGLATLTAVKGAVVMSVADVKGVDIAGITFDAGTKNSPVLLQIGSKAGDTNKSDPADPTALQDVFFRIGGPHVGKATVSLEVNSDNVILDNIWAWRADHGNPGTVGWDINTARNGVIVNGDNVTATGFFVEHFQEHNVIWNGNGGKVIFFQNELAYDPPSQAAWMQAPGVNGWAALKVADSVKTFKGYAMGSYSFFNQGVDIFAENAFEVPTTLPPGSLHNLLTIFLDPNTGKGGITHVVNGIGGSSTIANPSVAVTVADYPAVPDTTSPTVAITDNVPGTTATGDVTFTLTFSEDVGSSFTTSDIVVTGGTKGTFTRVDGTHATLVVSPPAAATGTLEVSVAVGTFTDIAGNTNTAAQTAQQAYDTTAPPPNGGGIITFDEATPPLLTGFGGAEDSTVVVDPTSAANKVAQVVKVTGAQTWAGTTVSTLANRAIAPIGFTVTSALVTARVWSPDSGIKVRLKVEDAIDPTKSVETEATTTVAGGWETLTFNFANQATGTAALNLATTYNKVSIFFDFGTAGTGKTYYLDDLSLPVASTVDPPPVVGPAWALTFDDSAVAYTLTDFGLYGAASAIVADPAGGTNKVAQALKYAGTSEQWGGTTVSTGANFSVDTIPFTAAKTKMTMRVYSPAVGVRVRMKVENAGNTGINCETDAFTTTSGAWETLTFDFGDPSTHYIPNGPTTYDLSLPTASLNVANTYNKVSVFFDFGRGGGYAPMPADRTYYFDDLSFIS